MLHLAHDQSSFYLLIFNLFFYNIFLQSPPCKFKNDPVYDWMWRDIEKDAWEGPRSSQPVTLPHWINRLVFGGDWLHALSKVTMSIPLCRQSALVLGKGSGGGAAVIYPHFPPALPPPLLLLWPFIPPAASPILPWWWKSTGITLNFTFFILPPPAGSLHPPRVAKTQ